MWAIDLAVVVVWQKVFQCLPLSVNDLCSSFLWKRYMRTQNPPTPPHPSHLCCVPDDEAKCKCSKTHMTCCMPDDEAACQRSIKMRQKTKLKKGTRERRRKNIITNPPTNPPPTSVASCVSCKLTNQPVSVAWHVACTMMKQGAREA